MQTFLPFPDFRASAAVLDRQRLGKQRIEGFQLLEGLLGKAVVIPVPGKAAQVIHREGGWINHPASLMWENNINALGIYTICMCEEWASRNYLDTTKAKIGMLIPGISTRWEVSLPSWLGDSNFHRSHRSNLIRKLPSHYRDLLGWNDPANLSYVWPRSS